MDLPAKEWQTRSHRRKNCSSFLDVQLERAVQESAQLLETMTASSLRAGSMRALGAILAAPKIPIRIGTASVIR